MRFGLALPQYDYSLPGRPIDWASMKAWAVRAEKLGYDSVWLSDHLFLDLEKYGGPSSRQGAFECFTSLAAIAAVTERVRLGSLVLCNDLRHPGLVAKMAATLDVLSQGRLTIGLGAGWYEREYHEAGISFDPPSVRIARLAEAVQIVTGMLESESFSFAGTHYRLKDAWNLPRAVQKPRPPVFVGGKGDKIVAVAGRYADGYNAVWAWTPRAYRGRIEILEEAAASTGRDPAAIRRTVGLYCLPGDPGEINTRLVLYAERTPVSQPATLSVDSWEDKLAGTAEDIETRIREFEELGVEEVILGFGMLPFQIADPSAVEWFAERVFPLFSG